MSQSVETADDSFSSSSPANARHSLSSGNLGDISSIEVSSAPNSRVNSNVTSPLSCIDQGTSATTASPSLSKSTSGSDAALQVRGHGILRRSHGGASTGPTRKKGWRSDPSKSMDRADPQRTKDLSKASIDVEIMNKDLMREDVGETCLAEKVEMNKIPHDQKIGKRSDSRVAQSEVLLLPAASTLSDGDEKMHLVPGDPANRQKNHSAENVTSEDTNLLHTETEVVMEESHSVVVVEHQISDERSFKAKRKRQLSTARDSSATKPPTKITVRRDTDEETEGRKTNQDKRSTSKEWDSERDVRFVCVYVCVV